MKEALSQEGVPVSELWLVEGKRSGRIGELIQLARDRNIPIRYRSASDFLRLFRDVAHQGVAARMSEFDYVDLDDLGKGGSLELDRGLLVAVDHITDEGNLGAIVRTAAFFGAEGLILPKDRSAAMSSRVLKRSSGGYLHLPVSRVVNMARALDLLEKRGYWIIGAAGDASESVYRFDWRRSLVLVMGNEEKGLSRTVRARCSQLVHIPRFGKIESLNVGVAAGIILS